MVLDASLLVLASALASLVARLVGGSLPRVADVVPDQGYGFWVAWTVGHAVLIPLSLFVLGQYRVVNDLRAGWSYMRVLATLLGSFLALIAYMSLLGQPITEIARVALHFIFALLLLCSWRGVGQRRLEKAVREGRRVRNVLLVGNDPAMESLGREIVLDPLHGRRLVGFARESVPFAPQDIPGMWVPSLPVPVEGAVVENSLRSPRHLWASYRMTDHDDRSRAIDGLGVEEVFVSNRLPDADIIDWIRLANLRGIDVHFVPLYHEALGIQAQPWKLGNHVMLDIHPRPINEVGWIAKRAMDIAGAIVGLAVGLPLLLLAALAIKIDTPKLPVLYNGRRVGMKGRSFPMKKLTTMRADAQKLEAEMTHLNTREGPWFKVDSDKDPRLTRAGRWIRKLSLNEIPQFWNVLIGDMSLVGPRPPTPSEVATYLQYDFRFYQVLDVKPGITGLWQVTARHDPSFDRRLKLDLQYMKEWSIWLDVKILFKTFGTVIGEREG